MLLSSYCFCPSGSTAPSTPSGAVLILQIYQQGRNLLLGHRPKPRVPGYPIFVLYIADTLKRERGAIRDTHDTPTSGRGPTLPWAEKRWIDRQQGTVVSASSAMSFAGAAAGPAAAEATVPCCLSIYPLMVKQVCVRW